MDVHDTSLIPRNIKLQPGMVITVEPGKRQCDLQMCVFNIDLIRCLYKFEEWECAQGVSRYGCEDRRWCVNNRKRSCCFEQELPKISNRHRNFGKTKFIIVWIFSTKCFILWYVLYITCCTVCRDKIELHIRTKLISI